MNSEEMAAELASRGWNVKAPPPPPVEPACSTCGTLESESAWGMLVPVEVLVNEGEEGHSHVRRQYCDDCFEPVQDGLIALGFTVHHHGGICFLEPHDCPGYSDRKACPTPEPQYPGEDDD